MTSLADWLRSHDLTDTVFAARIGVSRGTVGRYCRGERYPDPTTLLRIGHETAGAVTANDLLATWLAANPSRAPEIEVDAPGSTATGEAA